jgi:proline iminopeptidase
MQNGFYTPKNRTAEAKEIYAAFRADSVLSRKAMQMDYRAPKGFWESERYTTIDLSAGLAALHKKGLKIYGIYGQEDGLYAPEQIAGLAKIIGSENVRYLPDCSHNVFIDQQTEFIRAVKDWAR